MTAQADRIRNRRRAFAAPGSPLDRTVRWLALGLPALVGVVVALMIVTPLGPRGEVSFLLNRNKVATAPADYFDAPDAFRPERFAPEREKLLPRGAFMPFGGGPRICIGNHFALMEGQLILAALAQRLRFVPLDGRPVTPEPLVTLRPKGGLPMRVARL